MARSCSCDVARSSRRWSRPTPRRGRRALRAPLPILLASLPLGDLAMAWVVARATVLGMRRGGLVWRGTVYPTALLRAGRRVDM